MLKSNVQDSNDFSQTKVENSSNVNTGIIQAGRDVIFKSIYNNTSNNVPKYITGKPFSPELVLGRTDDLNLINTKLWNSSNLLVLINGEGGIGKTTLATQYWIDNENNYNHLGWLYVGNGIRPALLSMAERLGRVFDSTMSDTNRLESFLQYLSNLEKPSLLVLDNANNIQDIQAHYKALNSLNNFHILITSRINSISHISVYKVEGLSLSVAINLFETYYNEVSEYEKELLHKIFIAVGYNTLVIELIAKNLRIQNKFRATYLLNDLLNDLQNVGLLKIQSKPIETTYGNAELKPTKPEEIIRAMYDLTQLSANEIYLLCNMCVLPPENISYKQLNELMQSNSSSGFEEDLFKLHQKGWFEYNEINKSFKLNPVVQAVVIDKNKKELLQNCKQLINNLWQLFSNLNHTQLRPYAPFAVNVIESIKGNSLEIANLSVELSEHLKETGSLSQSMKFANIALRIYAKLDNNNTSYCTRLIGEIYQAQGRYTEANKFFNDALNLLKNNKQKNHVNLEEVVVKQRLAMLYLSEGKSEKAQDILQKLYVITTDLYKRHPNSKEVIDQLGQVCQNLGAIYYELGDLTKAMDYFQEMQIKFTKLVELDSNSALYKNGLAIALSRIGMVYRDLDNYNKSINCFDQYFSISKSIYDQNPQSEEYGNNLARAYDFLGRMYMNNGYLNKAKPLLHESYNLTKIIFENNPQSELTKGGFAISNDRLGELYFNEKKYDDALYYFEEYSRLSNELHDQNKNSESHKLGMAIAMSKIGQIFEEREEFNEALKFYIKCNEYGLQLHKNNPLSTTIANSLAISYAKLGYVYKRLSEREKALHSYMLAENIWSELCLHKQQSLYCDNLEITRINIANL